MYIQIAFYILLIVGINPEGLNKKAPDDTGAFNLL
jgi:hypothetical protein